MCWTQPIPSASTDTKRKHRSTRSSNVHLQERPLERSPITNALDFLSVASGLRHPSRDRNDRQANVLPRRAIKVPTHRGRYFGIHPDSSKKLQSPRDLALRLGRRRMELESRERTHSPSLCKTTLGHERLGTKTDGRQSIIRRFAFSRIVKSNRFSNSAISIAAEPAEPYLTRAHSRAPYHVA